MGGGAHSGTLKNLGKMCRYGRWGRAELQKQRDFQGEVLVPQNRGVAELPKSADSPGKTRSAMILTP